MHMLDNTLNNEMLSCVLQCWGLCIVAVSSFSGSIMLRFHSKPQFLSIGSFQIAIG